VKIVADSKIPYLKGVLEPYAEVEYYPGKEITSALIKHADALIVRTRTICNRQLLKGSTVKFIATATIGFDHIDTNYCRKKNIHWASAPGCNSGSVMQYVASALVFLSEKYNFSFEDKTIGIVGVGSVGSKVARMASTLGMNVLLNDPPRQRKEGKTNFVTLNEIQKNADIISFHVPLSFTGIDKTYHFFNDEFLDSIKPETILLNTSRGEIFSETVLKNGLTTKKIKSAILDVWQKEPNIDTELLKLVDIGTPHIAGYSVDGKANGTAMSVQAISRFFKLGLDKWIPSGIPSAKQPDFKIYCEKLTSEEILKKAIKYTYQIAEDSRRLKNSPETFEQQREEYPVRREFQFYKPELVNDKSNSTERLKKLGFTL